MKCAFIKLSFDKNCGIIKKDNYAGEFRKANMTEELNLKKLVGRRQVVVPRYVKLIESKLNESSDPDQIKILTAYLTAFRYYAEISNMQGNYVRSAMTYFNKEAQYLKEKFPFAHIEPQGRIKSPLSADKKIRDKIKEYIRDGRDLTQITTSLRDFIGFRYIITLPEILEMNPSKATDVCYQILEAQMDFQKENGFEFIPVGEKKLNKIKSNKSYSSNPAEKGVYIPKVRPEGIDEKYDEYLKDYIMFPTKTLYQSAQYCVIPPWAHDMTNGHLAAIEFQDRTSRMHDFAEHDELASHKFYKQRDDDFHRLRIPFEFSYIPDEYGNLTDTIDLLPFDYSVQKHYGYSFSDKFGISYEDFEKYDDDVQDQVYAGNYHFKYVDGDYVLVTHPESTKGINVVRRYMENAKFKISHPIKTMKSLFSFSSDDRDYE